MNRRSIRISYFCHASKFNFPAFYSLKFYYHFIIVFLNVNPGEIKVWNIVLLDLQVLCDLRASFNSY